MTPDEQKIIREFLDALTQEEESVRQDLASDRLGMAFRTTINELDWYVWNYAQQKEPTEEQSEQYYLISLGVARLIVSLRRGPPSESEASGDSAMMWARRSCPLIDNGHYRRCRT